MVVESFHISRPFRRRGLGRRLFACALRQARQAGGGNAVYFRRQRPGNGGFLPRYGLMPADPILPEDARQNPDDLRLCCPVDALSRP